MATSTILENIRVNNPKVIEEFVNFKEKEASEQHPFHESSTVCTDSERMKAFIEKALKNEDANK